MTRIGLFGIGLDTYWSQFKGLPEELIGYQEVIKNHISSFDVEVVNAGMLDNPEKAHEAASFLKKEDNGCPGGRRFFFRILCNGF
jgi:L-arabinose isomerase